MTDITNATPATQEITPSTGIAVDQLPGKQSLLTTMAQKWGVESNKLLNTLKHTVFKPVKQKDNTYIPVTDEQLMALLIVADQYNLNPFVKEIYAFPAKDGGIVPVVGVDGWTRIINDHPQYDGIDFRCSEELVTLDGAQPCFQWIECIIYRKDRDKPTTVREYLDECYKTSKYNNSPWQTHPKRFLRHKALIQAARYAFGFTGIYDKDEAHRIVDAQAVNTANAKDITPPASKIDAFAASAPLPTTPTPVKEEKPVTGDTPASDPVTGEVMEQPQETLLPENETGEVVSIKTPPGSTPPRVACNSVKIAAKKMLKAIESRYQNGQHEEITWIVKNNAELLERIKKEEPEKFVAITDLSKVIPNEPTNIYTTQGELA